MLLFRRIRPGLAPLAAVFLAALPVSAAVAAAAAAGIGQVAPSPAIQRLLDADTVKVGGSELDGDSLRGLYRSRSFQPLWAASEERRAKLVEMLNEAGRDGLDPAAYNTSAIKARLGAEGDKAAELDLLLTDAALRYGRHLRLGRVGPADAEQDWQHPAQSFDAAAFLLKAAKDDALAGFDALPPPYAGYAALREVLGKYRELRKGGGWKPVPTAGTPIKPGMEDDRIPAIRGRLAVTGDYPGADMDSRLLDDELVQAVQRFQARHGLETDGILGRGTINTMNVPVESRIRQIVANMERWRWLPRQLEGRHVAVNIAAQTLEAVDGGKVAMSTRVIVGKPTHKTLSFRATISSVTLNPPWRVPTSIASKEILPELKKNPGYLVANRLKIVGFQPGTPEAEGIGIDWNAHTSFPYLLRQDPGEDNSLGRLKFNMPNGNDIYLHDTPARSLFAKARRAFSHGCVRVEEPLHLAALLINKPDITAETLQEMIGTQETRQVALGKPVPVYLFYFTAWVDGDGVVQFRDDIYGYDRALGGALSRVKEKRDLLAKG